MKRPKTHDHIIVMTTSPGYWGKGKTMGEAIKNAEWINGGDEVVVIICGEEAYVDEMGGICYDGEVGYYTVGKGTVNKQRNGVMLETVT